MRLLARLPNALKPWIGLIVWLTIELVLLLIIGFDRFDWQSMSIIMAMQVAIGAWLDGL